MSALDINRRRYAIYFAPPRQSPLWRFGSAVIGYDAATGHDEPFQLPDGYAIAEWAALTAEPRRYGFHATLRAPFSLADGISEDDFLRLAQSAAATTKPVVLPGLTLNRMRSFLALTADSAGPELKDLAAHIVLQTEPARGALEPADRDRRLKANLSPRQIDYLDRHGYPYVLDDFQFHMTLTGKLTEPQAALVQAHLADAFARHVPAGPVAIDEVSVFRQERRDGRFIVIARFPLGA